MSHEDIYSKNFTHRGLSFTFVVKWDGDMREPWKEHDGHGVVSDWTTRDKAPGERVLVQDRQSFRYYDVEATTKIALKDGWDTKPYKTGTKRERAARAVDADFEYLRGWCHDEWTWAGVEVTRVDTGEKASIWGIESNADEYHGDVARELAEDLIHDDADRAKLEATRVVAPWPDVR